MKKILLISTSKEENAQSKIDKEKVLIMNDSCHYPLGLAYLYSVLEQAGHEVQYLFFSEHAYEDCYNEIKEKLETFSPDIVAFQILTFNRVSAYRMIEYIHEKYPLVNLIIGGIHTTVMHQSIIKKYPYVIAVLAEGELTILELVKELSQPSLNLHSVDGIVFSENGIIVKTRSRELIKNIDEIPFPKHELFFKGNRTCGDILTTRGCPFNCSFCCLNSTSQYKVRMRTVDNIIKEIEWMAQKFPKMTDIWIHDDTFFVDNQRVIDFCDEIIKRNIKINFSCQGRVKPVSEKMVKKLEQANFKRVSLGIESGDIGILKRCRKGITQEDIIKAFSFFAKTKISITAFLIIGLPGENINTVTETANFLKKLQKIIYNPNYGANLLKIFPGTEIYEIAKTAGFIDDNYWLTDKPVPFFTVENSYEQLIQLNKILLYNVSPVMAFFTWTGFKAQFFIIPYHLKFIFSNKTNAKYFFIRIIKFILPAKSYEFIKELGNYKKQ